MMLKFWEMIYFIYFFEMSGDIFDFVFEVEYRLFYKYFCLFCVYGYFYEFCVVVYVLNFGLF